MLPAARAGDRAAVAALWDLVGRPAAWRQGRRYASWADPTTREDLQQDAYLVFQEAIERWDASRRASFLSWYFYLLGVRRPQKLFEWSAPVHMPYKCLGRVRGVEGKAPFTSAPLQPLKETLPDVPTSWEDHQWVWGLVRRVCSFQQRRVLWARYGKGLSIDQTAARLGLTPGTLYQHHKRAIAKLQKEAASHV